MRNLFCDLWLQWASHRLARTTIRKYGEFFQNRIIRITQLALSLWQMQQQFEKFGETRHNTC